jgi:hypothetical protein
MMDLMPQIVSSTSAAHRHPCPDCKMCQCCSETRCRACRSSRKNRTARKLSIREQIELYNSLNPCLQEE